MPPSETQKAYEFVHATRKLTCACGVFVEASILLACDVGWQIAFPDKEEIRDEDISGTCPDCVRSKESN